MNELFYERVNSIFPAPKACIEGLYDSQVEILEDGVDVKERLSLDVMQWVLVNGLGSRIVARKLAEDIIEITLDTVDSDCNIICYVPGKSPQIDLALTAIDNVTSDMCKRTHDKVLIEGTILKSKLSRKVRLNQDGLEYIEGAVIEYVTELKRLEVEDKSQILKGLATDINALVFNKSEVLCDLIGSL